MRVRKKSCILAIESSCDDTSVAILDNGNVLCNLITSQAIHEQYGGIVPEVASRAHLENILPVLKAALAQSGKDLHDLNAVAVTRGPGLLGSLIVGVSFAKGLALALNVPLIEVNHMEAHVLAHFAELPHPSFPFLCLTVSGGHTQIVKAHSHLKLRVLGETRDDAAGEAFDKSGKLLGLGYPAGPLIDQLAKQGTAKYTFPKPKIPDLDFSFSGLKTAILYFLKDNTRKNPDFIKQNINDICASIQQTIVNILMDKLILAAQKTGIRQIAIAGGVSANSELRERITELGKEMSWEVYIPDFQYCTDNAGMVGIVGHYKFLAGLYADHSIEPIARFPVGSQVT